MRLLAKVPVGRVVYTWHALPAVLPVNFSMDDDASVVLYTSAGSDLVRAVDGVVVASRGTSSPPRHSRAGVWSCAAEPPW
jgi:hypothetical protein